MSIGIFPDSLKESRENGKEGCKENRLFAQQE